MKIRFDQKFGSQFFDQIPSQPGVYRFLDSTGRAIYVGKAKNLRRRLGQYRRARRLKAHRKMRTLVEKADKIIWQCLATETDALLEEARLIRELRPCWNVAGAFSFLYPYLGISQTGQITQIYLTHRPTEHDSAELFGCYRSRKFTELAFDSLNELLGFVAPRVPRREKLAHGAAGPGGWVRPEKIAAFRGLHPEWMERLRLFLREGSTQALEELVLELSDYPAARRSGRQVQLHLNALKYFKKWEVLPLKRARSVQPEAAYPVAQKDRDPMFILLSVKKAEAKGRALNAEKTKSIQGSRFLQNF